MLKTSLRYLMSVARHGSIRAASAELNIAQSAVSRRIQALEYQVGTPLFERRPRGVVLTEAGELLYAHCLSTSFAVERLQSEIDELRGLMRGRIRIAAIESATSSLLGEAIRGFTAKHPNITFAIEIATSDKVLATVLKGTVDIGLSLGDDYPREIEVLHSAKEPFFAAMSPQHQLAGQESVTIEELARWPLALAPLPSSSRLIFDRCCARHGIEVKPTLETNSVDLMRSFASSGAGLAAVLNYAVKAQLTAGTLVAIPVADADFAIEVNVIALEGRKLPLASERFVAAILNEYDKPPHTAAA